MQVPEASFSNSASHPPRGMSDKLDTGKKGLSREIQVVRYPPVSHAARKRHHNHNPRGGPTLEVLTRPGSVQEFRQGKITFDDCVLYDDIWLHPYNQSHKASLKDVGEVLGVDNLDKRKAIELILLEGDCPTTSQERHKDDPDRILPDRHERILGE